MPATDDALIPRDAARQVATALADTPVVMLNGPRQCGKTTLVRDFAVEGRRYISLDDETALTGVPLILLPKVPVGFAGNFSGLPGIP